MSLNDSHLISTIGLVCLAKHLLCSRFWSKDFTEINSGGLIIPYDRGMVVTPTLQMRKWGKDWMSILPQVTELLSSWSRILIQKVRLQSPCSDRAFTLSQGRWPFHCWPAQMIRHEIEKLLKFFLHFSIICDVCLIKIQISSKELCGTLRIWVWVS